MEYKKRLKARLYTGVVYAVIAVALMVFGFFMNIEMASPFGLMFLVLGIARIRNYFYITKDEERMKKLEISETDERNIKIWKEARNLAFVCYVLIATLGIVVAYLLGYNNIGLFLSYNTLVIMLIYFICYFIMRKKY